MSGTSALRQSARVCFIFAAIFGRSVLASEPLTIHVSPRVATEPATLELQVIVERDSENRGLEILVDSADYSRSSFVQLDGEAAPRVTTVEVSSVPGGSYEVRATLYGPGSRQRASTSSTVEVMSRSGR